VFGCWASISRKSALPVLEELDSLLFYPVQYERVSQKGHGTLCPYSETGYRGISHLIFSITCSV